MFLNKDKILILAALILVIGLLIATSVVSWSKRKSNTNGSVVLDNREDAPKNNFSNNVFSPNLPKMPEDGGQQFQSESVPPIVKAPAARLQFQFSLPSLNDLKSLISSSSPSYFTLPLKKEELLPLPQVSDNEININQNGVRDMREYFRYLAIHYKEVDFDYKKLNETIRKGDKFYPSPAVLIDRMLQTGDFISTQSSLGVLREFAVAKIEFEKKIKVAAAAVSYSQNIIAFDKLTLQLIDKFNDLSAGALTRSEFNSFYGKYKNTEKFYGESFLKAGGLARAGGDDNNVFSKILGFLDLRNVAQAQLPVGGPVILQTICTCSFVGAITVGPPVGGSFTLPPFFALFPNFSPTIGNFVLGLYEPTPVPCLQYVVLACIPDPLIPGTLGPVIMLGTS